MFSATVSVSNSEKCWKTMAMPRLRASWGLAIDTGAPLKCISPASGRTAPKMIFMRVDLPAPFSPRTAWISPGATVRLTSSLAVTPG